MGRTVSQAEDEVQCGRAQPAAGAAGRVGLDGFVVVGGVRTVGVVVMATVVVPGGGKCRRYRENKQGSEENLLHAKNVAPTCMRGREDVQAVFDVLHQERKQGAIEQNAIFAIHRKRAYHESRLEVSIRMPYDLPLPDSLKPWKVKIFDNELLFEEPHVTIIFKTTRWRFSLRGRRFLDPQPDPNDVRHEVLAKIDEEFQNLCNE